MSWKGVKNQTNIENIKAWCDEMGIENYTINSQGEIDVDDDVLLMENDFKELPYKFGKVTGFFSLESCKNLISLKNCPKFIEPNHMFNIDFCFFSSKLGIGILHKFSVYRIGTIPKFLLDICIDFPMLLVKKQKRNNCLLCSLN